MDPGYFADPDPDFKNPNPDPSLFLTFVYSKSTTLAR